MNTFVPDQLRLKAELYEQRNRLYGDNYKRFGDLMTALFPYGIVLTSKEDHNRWAIFNMMMVKMSRYAENFSRGGHDDSLDDIAVYAMMLKELDIGLHTPEEE